MNVQGIPPLPAEAGECVVMYGKPRHGDWYHGMDGWEVIGDDDDTDYSECWLIARPVSPKRLEWTWDAVFSCWRSAPYSIFCGTASGMFSVAGASPVSCDTLAEAKAACQRHADEQKRPTVEQPKAKTPAVEIQWPEGAISITRDRSGKLFCTTRHARGWYLFAYHGPDPFPANLDWRQCYLINPACLSK